MTKAKTTFHTTGRQTNRILDHNTQQPEEHMHTPITLRRLTTAGITIQARLITIESTTEQGRPELHATVLPEDIEHLPDWILDTPVTGIHTDPQTRIHITIDKNH